MHVFGCVKNAKSGISGGLENYIGAALDLSFRQLLAFPRVIPRGVCDAYVVFEHLYFGICITGPFGVSGLEFMNERYVHTADKSDFTRLRCTRGDHAYQERTFVLFENQGGDIRKIDYAVDDREFNVWIVASHVVHDRRLGETNSDDQVVATFGKGTHRRFD